MFVLGTTRIAILIDFDRMKAITKDSDPSFDGEMYVIPPGGNCIGSN